VIKVFENFDFSRVGQMQSLLESHGIPTFVKNQFSSSVMGEVPFVEVCPQLYILDAADLEAAQNLLRPGATGPADAEDWVCAKCGMKIDGQFERCWNCAGRVGS